MKLMVTLVLTIFPLSFAPAWGEVKQVDSVKFDKQEPSGFKNGQMLTFTLLELKSKYLNDEFGDTPQFFIETEIEEVYNARRKHIPYMGVDVAGDYSRVFTPNQSGTPLKPNEIIFSVSMSEINSIMTNATVVNAHGVLYITLVEDDYLGNDQLKQYKITLKSFLAELAFYYGKKDQKELATISRKAPAESSKEEVLKTTTLMQKGLVKLKVNENIYALIKVNIK